LVCFVSWILDSVIRVFWCLGGEFWQDLDCFLVRFFVLLVALDVLWVIFSRVEIGAAVEAFNPVDVMIFGF
jgi:hypothetical protein